MSQITLSLPQGLIEKVKVYTKSTGRTFSGFVKFCLEKKLEEDNDASKMD